MQLIMILNARRQNISYLRKKLPTSSLRQLAAVIKASLSAESSSFSSTRGVKTSM